MERGALNPNSVLCTDQAPSPGFSALNPGSALNPRTLNQGTTVYTDVLSVLFIFQFDGVNGDRLIRVGSEFTKNQKFTIEELKEQRRKDQKLDDFLTGEP